MQLLGFGSEDEVSAAAVPDLAHDGQRNTFEWSSRSYGAQWQGMVSGLALELRTWSAEADASAGWNAETGEIAMAAARRDVGALASLQWRRATSTTAVGARLERIQTDYRITEAAADASDWTLGARTPVWTLFAHHAGTAGRRAGFELGASLSASGGRLYLAPRGQLRFRIMDPVTLSVSFARTHQFAQSLRNPESIVAYVFPADLFVGSPNVPVARGDQIVFAADYRLRPGVQLGVQAYRRVFADVVLVAPHDGEPFATSEFGFGAGRSLGASVSGSLSSNRVAVVASYGLQHLRLGEGEVGYTPTHGTTHVVETGAIVFPSATSSVRLGVTSAFGRRSTAQNGALEFEACNLADGGCEFAGSPSAGGVGSRLGGTALPAYLRVDISARKEWTFVVRGREAAIALFGTLSNVLGRENILTLATDVVTGEVDPIDMRPLAPLVVGLDWRF